MTAAKTSKSPVASDQSVHKNGATNGSKSSSSPSRKNLTRMVLAILLVGSVVINGGLYLYYKQLEAKNQNGFGNIALVPSVTNTPTPSPSPTPTPYPLPQGKQVYRLSHGKSVTGPKMTEVTVDPFDPKIGEKQTYTVKINHTSPVISATLELQTDNNIKTYNLDRIDGTPTSGTWQVTITTDDVHFYKYYAQFDLKSATDEYKGGLTFRAY